VPLQFEGRLPQFANERVWQLLLLREGYTAAICRGWVKHAAMGISSKN
jgi:hypothetical protein